VFLAYAASRRPLIFAHRGNGGAARIINTCRFVVSVSALSAPSPQAVVKPKRIPRGCISASCRTRRPNPSFPARTPTWPALAFACAQWFCYVAVRGVQQAVQAVQSVPPVPQHSAVSRDSSTALARFGVLPVTGDRKVCGASTTQGTTAGSAGQLAILTASPPALSCGPLSRRCGSIVCRNLNKAQCGVVAGPCHSVVSHSHVGASCATAHLGDGPSHAEPAHGRLAPRSAP
jgi:hypothetical protein